MLHILASFVLTNHNNELLADIMDIKNELKSDNFDFENIVDQIPKQHMTALPGAEIFSSAVHVAVTGNRKVYVYN